MCVDAQFDQEPDHDWISFASLSNALLLNSLMFLFPIKLGTYLPTFQGHNTSAV